MRRFKNENEEAAVEVQDVSDNDHGNDGETPAGRGENEDEVEYYGEEEEELVMSDEEQQFYLQGTNVRA
jgi:hypothetical protein